MSDLFAVSPTLHLQLPHYAAVSITLAGCGGTGSHLASGLVAIAQALAGRNVHVDMLFVDPERVEPRNVGRQLFSLADVGQPKAEALAGRLNAAFGLAIGASVRAIDSRDSFLSPDRDALNVVIGAVDNPAARSRIARAVKKADGRLWWLDVGNDHYSGQIAIGNIGSDVDKRQIRPMLGMIEALPAPHLVYPDLIAIPKKKLRRRVPSCAELAEDARQGLMVNRMAAAWACALLHDFLLGELKYFALAFDLGWGGVRTWTLDEQTLRLEDGRHAKTLTEEQP